MVYGPPHGPATAGIVSHDEAMSDFVNYGSLSSGSQCIPCRNVVSLALLKAPAAHTRVLVALRLLCVELH